MQDHPSTSIRARASLTLALFLTAVAPAVADSAKEIARGMRVNQQLLQDFTWKSRAETTVNGKTRNVQLFDVRYDMDGGLLKAPVEGEASPRRGRGKDLSPEMKALVDAYTHLTPVTLKEVFGKATIGPGEGDDARLIRVQAEGVKSLGDRVEIWVDRESKRPRRYEIATTMDGKDVRIETEFTDLPGGPAYPARTTVHTKIKAKPLVLSIENFEFTLQGG